MSSSSSSRRECSFRGTFPFHISRQDSRRHYGHRGSVASVPVHRRTNVNCYEQDRSRSSSRSRQSSSSQQRRFISPFHARRFSGSDSRSMSGPRRSSTYLYNLSIPTRLFGNRDRYYGMNRQESRVSKGFHFYYRLVGRNTSSTHRRDSQSKRPWGWQGWCHYSRRYGGILGARRGTFRGFQFFIRIRWWQFLISYRAFSS